MYMSRRANGFNEAIDKANNDVGRLAYNQLSILCLIVIGILFGTRIRCLFGRNKSKMNPIRVLVILLHIFALALIYVENTMSSGVEINNRASCLATGVLDTLFFFAGKVTLHVFLVERVRLARARMFRRWRDWTWIVPMCVLGSGFISLGIVAFRFLDHVYEDGVCLMGFPDAVAISLLSYDLIVSSFLTALFIYLLGRSFRPPLPPRPAGPQEAISPPASLSRPNLRSESRSMSIPPKQWWRDSFISKESTITIAPVQSTVQPVMRYAAHGEADHKMQKLIMKTLIGACLLYFPFIVNLAFLVATHGLEKAWFCFMICTLDSTWCLCVVHWLTSTIDDVDEQT